jgi:pSer/pThr/pTyr-binding forkhead associated (FHA) protein
MAASFNLIIEDDAGKQIVVPFARDIITIGRKEGNTIRLTERNVSRFHAKLSKEDGHVLVEDLKSFNGVKLNGDRIAGRVQVTAGDVIEIGDYHLELRSSQPVSTQKLGPAHKSAAVAEDDAEGDDFEGDTQRWDPPPAGGALSVGGVTQEAPPGASQFGDNSGDTERLDMDKLNQLGGLGAQSWPPPESRNPQPAPTPGDLEPTARQPMAYAVPVGGVAPSPPSAPTAPLPVAPPPVAAPPAPPPLAPPAPAPASAQAVPSLAPVLEPLGDDATQDMPLPAARAAIARHAEQTEQIRPAPSQNPADDVSVPRLVVLNTIFSGSTFPLRAAESVLGRTDDNDIVLEHKSVSRNHAKLVREGERTRILDLKSANGVLVNNEEVETHVLRSGDIIELGKVKIRFVPVGERFAVAPDEIERARVADAAGDDFEEGAQTVNVTSPLRQRVTDAPAMAPNRPVVLYAIVGVLVLVVVILLAIVVSRGGGATADATDDVDPDNATAVLLAEAPPVDPTAPTPPDSAPPPPPTEPTEVPSEVPTELELGDIADDPADTEPAGAAGVEKVRRKKASAPKLDTKRALADAQTAMLAREFGTAVRLLEAVVDREPKNAQAHLNLGIAYARQRKNPKAREHYELFLKLEPTGAQADMVRGTLNGLR